MSMSNTEKHVKDIRRKTRRKFSSEEKIRIVLDGLRGEYSIAELCRKEGINNNLYCPSSNKWNRPSDYLVESFVPHCHVTRHAAGSANDVSRWSSS